MLRLRPGPRATFGEKVLDLANLAAASMVFAQLVGTEPLSWTIIVLGVAFWFGCAAFGLWLMGAW